MAQSQGLRSKVHLDPEMRVSKASLISVQIMLSSVLRPCSPCAVSGLAMLISSSIQHSESKGGYTKNIEQPRVVIGVKLVVPETVDVQAAVIIHRCMRYQAPECFIEAPSVAQFVTNQEVVNESLPVVVDGPHSDPFIPEWLQ